MQRSVVPYNPYLIRYGGHVNVGYWIKSNSIKYCLNTLTKVLIELSYR